MSGIILCFICSVTSALYYIIIYAVYGRQNTKSKSKSAYLHAFALSAVISLSAAVLFDIVLAALKIDADFLNLCLPLAALSLCISVLISKRAEILQKNTRITRFLRDIAISAIVVILLEMSLFNYSAYSSPKSAEIPLDLSKCTADNSVTVINDGSIRINSNAETALQFYGLSADVSNIAVEYKNEGSAAGLSISVKDSNLSQYFTEISNDERILHDTEYYTITSKGMTALRLLFTNADGVSISAVKLNVPKPLTLNLLRIAVLMMICAAAFAVRDFKLYKIILNTDSKKQTAVFVIAFALCAAALFGIYSAQEISGLVEYTGSAEAHEPYYQMFDAFQKGQLNLDIPVDQKLISAGDMAYDTQYRYAENITAEWDRAYFDGKYYSYFGTAPLFLFYYPVYLLTHMLPSASAACTFFAILLLLFGFFLVIRIARRVVNEANFLLTLLSALLLPVMSGAYILCAYGDFYNIPKLCALAFLLLLFDLSIEGFEHPKWYIFLLCGMSSAVILASRPNMIIPALALAPLYIGVLTNKSVTAKSKIGSIFAFILPVILCISALMIYNYARFGAFFEFGSKYQLTVNNIASNNISLGFFGAAIFHYFLQMPNFSGKFPYFSPSYIGLDYSRYFYINSSFGVFALPLNLIIAAFPAVFKKSSAKPQYKALVITIIAAAAVTAFLDFSVAGLTISYVCDIAAAVAAAAFITMLMLEKCTRKHAYLHKCIYISCGVTAAISAFIGIMLLLSTEPYFVKNNMPFIYDNIQRLFCF